MAKKCVDCRKVKPSSEFYGKRNDCKTCTLLANKKWWARNRKKMSATRRKKYLTFRQWFDNLKRKPCTDCKAEFPTYCMDWDHLRDKKFNLGRTNYYGKKRTLLEIAKCELVCANCHRIRTHKRKEAKGGK